MENLFDIILKNRTILSRVLESTPKEKLVKIPAGFNNNIWWNIAHVVVTQQLLVYKMSNLPMKVDTSFVAKFKKGTTPDGTVTDAEIETIKSFLLPTVTWLKEDYKKGLFKEFNEYTTSANVTLRNVKDAIAFNVFHEGLHLGAIIALKKALI
ncbi:DinB family protein [Maribacter vaceletii]|uniref:DinB family protein n=1 Tax=Maribacter vaceletii TaxID=1206816 RepID=A0A495EDN1_9FLAO|nr:DinB family protein [Maribacter vaceletii]RKR14995.1 DinB family protein [Maribacter vaceletii]